jgi:predicted Zn-dependent protease
LFLRPAVRLLRVTVLIGAFFFFPSSPRSLELISVEQEIQIGREAHAQMRRETPLLRDAAVSDYVSGVARRLVRVASGPKYPYSFTVANANEVNAFALPGGPVWVNRGVLHVAANESQVASVLAHEIAHIAQRHAAAQLTKAAIANWGLGLLGAMLGNTGGAGTAQVAGGFLASESFRQFSRDDERDADRAGLLLLTRAGWDARGMIELFDILRREQGRDPNRVESFFSTHPSPQERIAELQAAVKRHKGGRRDTAEFRAIKARLFNAPRLKSRPAKP